MTPENKIKRAILMQAKNEEDLAALDGIRDHEFATDEDVERGYHALTEAGAHWDYESEFRSGDVETGIPAMDSRHYESKSVATKMSDGSWVGWTYWYGGGKHGEPDAIDWMEDAYDLTCVETEKLVTVREFTKVEA